VKVKVVGFPGTVKQIGVCHHLLREQKVTVLPSSGPFLLTMPKPDFHEGIGIFSAIL
jgi:hypothetical protein